MIRRGQFMLTGRQRVAFWVLKCTEKTKAVIPGMPCCKRGIPVRYKYQYWLLVLVHAPHILVLSPGGLWRAERMDVVLQSRRRMELSQFKQISMKEEC